MCGRFARYSLSRDLERFFNAHPPDFEIHPNYNVAPTQEIPVIVQHEDERHIKKRHWGLVPFWAKDTSIGSRMINARVETVTSKPAFRTALKQRRCLILAAEGVNDLGLGKAFFGVPSVMGELDVFARGAVFVLALDGVHVHAIKAGRKVRRQKGG